MDILETLGLSGENIPQEYGHGISKDVIKAQKEEEERIKYLNDLKYQLDITRQQLNTANQTNKQIVEENNSLKIDVDAKESVINVLVKSILPKFDELQKTVNSSQKNTIDLLIRLEDNFDGKLYAVLVKFDEILTEMEKITTTQTDRIISEIGKLPLSKEQSDEIDAIVRTELGKTVDTQTTMIVSETIKIHEAILNIPKPNINDNVMSELWKIHELVTNLPKPIDVSPALENIRNGLFEGFKYVCKCDEGVTEIIKNHIDLIPKPHLPQFVDLSKIEDKIEEINDRTTYLVEETDDKIDNIMEIVEALKQGVPIKQPIKEPLKQPPISSNTIKPDHEIPDHEIPDHEISEPEKENLYPDSSSDDDTEADIESDATTKTDNTLEYEKQESVKPRTFTSNSNLNSNSDKQESVKPRTNTTNNSEGLNSDKQESVKPRTNTTNNSEGLNSNSHLTPNQKKIIEYIKKNPEQTNKEISEGTGISKTTLSAVLKLLIEMDILLIKGKCYYLKP